MKYRILHRTAYQYKSAVVDSFNELRLRPVSNEEQICHSFDLRISPEAVPSHYHDFYLNIVNVFEVGAPHERLSIEAESVVETLERGDAAVKPSAFADYRASALETMCYDFLQSSEYVSTGVEVWRYAMDVCAERKDPWICANRLMQAVFKNFEYSPKATTVNTHMEDVLRFGKGVCQDFAHLMIGLCRCLEIPTRYVSGYIHTRPGPGGLRGAQASHAWCEVFVPGQGWLGLDPTNNCRADGNYIKVAVGRDYADITPVRGTYRGGGQREMEVFVDVIPL